MDAPNPNLDPVCELFRRGDPDYNSITLLGKLWVPTGGAFIGSMVVLATNLVNRKPLLSGIHRLAVWSIGGFALGAYLMEKRRVFLAERDLQYYHYMTLHPEDFAPRERVKYKDYLGPWLPIR